MSYPDLVNGSFEFLGGILFWMSVRRAYLDKEFKGISIAPTAFFGAWGLWNLFYYPHLGQWISFFGGINIVVANLVWVGQMFYYAPHRAHRRREKEYLRMEAERAREEFKKRFGR